jgi:hypothetical protein
VGKAARKQALKRKFARAWIHLDAAAKELALAYPDFADTHPDLANLIEAMGKETLLIQAQIEDFWRLSWGELPTSFWAWR